MRKTSQHLNDEHMRLYEWSGAGPGITLNLPARSKRSHPWHASNAVLAVMTTLLILNGCDSKASSAGAPSGVDQAKPSAAGRKGPLYDEIGAEPAQAEPVAPAANGTSDPALEKSELPDDARQDRERTLPA